MSGDKEVFQAVISAKDETSGVLTALHDRFRHLAGEADHVGHSIEHMRRPHVFAEMGEHVSLVKEHFGELHATVGEVGSSIAELLPALGALGAFGTVASLFETAEHVAESYAQLAHVAEALGMATDQLQHLRIVATLTDTDVEGMEKSMSRLNRVISDAASGHNKDAAAAFARIGISLRDSSGHLRSANDILPQLADGFSRTGAAADRTRAAIGFFGKSGVDLVPLLRKGGGFMREQMGEAKELGFDFGPYAKGLEHYNESMKKLTVATHGFTDEVGAKLAPVLAPVVDMATHWVLANRDWIATGIAGKVGELSGWLEKIDWKGVGTELEHWTTGVGHFVDAIGGAKRVSEIFGGILLFKGVEFAAGPLIGVYKFSAEVVKLGNHVLDLVGYWGKVGDAAQAAELRAASLSGIGAAHGPGAAVAGAAHGPGAAVAGAAHTSEAAAMGADASLGSSGLDRVRANAIREAHGGGGPGPATAHSIRSRGLMAAMQIGFDAWEASDESTDLTNKDTIRKFPALAHYLSRKEFEALPEHDAEGPSMIERILHIRNDDAHPGLLERLNNDMQAPRQTLFGASPRAYDDGLPFKVDGSIQTTLTIVGLPPGASVVADTRTTGIVKPPAFASDLSGGAFGGDYGHR